jgi:hypothetical protein
MEPRIGTALEAFDSALKLLVTRHTAHSWSGDDGYECKVHSVVLDRPSTLDRGGCDVRWLLFSAPPLRHDSELR